MNKAELINAVAAAAEVSKKDAEAVLTATLDAITDALKEGDKVQLVGFGSFEVKSAPPASAATPRPRSPSKSPPPWCPCSRPARPSRTAFPSNTQAAHPAEAGWAVS